MTNEERQIKIETILNRLNEIYPQWLFLGMQIRNETFSNENDKSNINSKWNSFDIEMNNLNIELRDLQTEYQVDHFDINGIMVTSLLRLNRKTNIDTFLNGWSYYENQTDARLLILDVFRLLKNTISKVELANIKTL